MSAKVTCACGKEFTWKLAGRRGKCKCGQVVLFPAQAPEPESFELNDLAALEEAGRPAVQTTPVPAPASLFSPPASQPSAKNAEQPGLLKKLGFLALGLAMTAYFAIWPMIQVLQLEPSISISFKGMVLSVLMLTVGLNAVCLGDKGIPWKKERTQPLTLIQRGVVIAMAASAIGVCGLIWLFFNQHGYSVKF